jgi:hypothetical protein
VSGSFARFANILPAGRQRNHGAVIAIEARIAGDDEIRVAGQFDHESFCFKPKLALELAFGPANRANTPCFRRIHIGEPKLHPVNSATITVRPVNTGPGRQADRLYGKV